MIPNMICTGLRVSTFTRLTKFEEQNHETERRERRAAEGTAFKSLIPIVKLFPSPAFESSSAFAFEHEGEISKRELASKEDVQQL